MENINEDYKNLSELVRTAYKLISPMTYHDDVDRLTPEFVMDDAKKKPGCYLKLGQGADHTLFPICNRYGYKDPKMIKFSLKLAKRIAEKNQERDMSGTIIKLERLLSKYDKPVPNTVSQAVLKGKATKMFNQKMKINEIIQSKVKAKVKEKLKEWGNSDLNKDDRAKKFVQDMYNIKENAKDRSIEENLIPGVYDGIIPSGLKKLKKRSDRQTKVALGIGGAVLGGAAYGIYKTLKGLINLLKKEKDPVKRKTIKKKIAITKVKLNKAKKVNK